MISSSNKRISNTSILLAAILFLGSNQNCLAGGSQLKPVLKAIDPSMAKIDLPTAPTAAKTSGLSEMPKPAPDRFQMQNAIKRIENLEKIAFGYTYPEHGIEDRLDHLETDVFGKKSTQESDARISELEAKLGTGQGAFGKADMSMAQSANMPATAPSRNMPTAVMQNIAPLQNDSVDMQAQAITSNDPNLNSILHRIPYDTHSGDYFGHIRKFNGGYVARWNKFPITVHMPKESPQSWMQMLDSSLKKWAQYMPIMAVDLSQPADVEIGWVSHLSSGQFGLTNLEYFNGRMRVTIYLVRPTSYPPEITENTLAPIALHEFGHALGIFGHSLFPGDIMQTIESPQNGKTSFAVKYGDITARDLNTLLKIYRSQSLPDNIDSFQPMGWP